MKGSTIPSHLQTALWSVDINRLNLKKDKNYIITQVLNFGSRKDQNWLFNNYDTNVIKEILIHPTRGMWYRERLRRWLAYFNIMTDPLEFEAAIKDLNPRPILTEEVWKRKGILKQNVPSRNTL